MNEEINETLLSGEIINDETSKTLTAKIDNKAAEPIMLCEDKERRSGNIKHFKMSDGSWQAVISNEPMHYYNATEGKMRSIDNTLYLKNEMKDADDFEGYENRYNNFKVRFAKNASGSKLMRIVKDDYEINFGLIGRRANALQSNSTGTDDKVRSIQAIVNNAAKAKMAEVNKFPGNRHTESEIKYCGLMDGVDLEYTLKSDHVKENIVIKSRDENFEIAFRVLTKNVVPLCGNDGKTVNFYSVSVPETADEEPVFSMPASFMYDNAGKTSYDIIYEIEQITDNEYILKIKPDSDWLNNAERVYPVTIDPTIIIKGTSKLVYKMADNNRYPDNSEFYQSGLNRKNVGFKKFNVTNPEVAKNYEGETYLYIGLKNASDFLKNRINNAKISLAVMAAPTITNTSGKFSLYGISESSSWMNRTLTWDNKPKDSGEVLAVSQVEKDGDAYYINFDITTALQNYPNGFVIKAEIGNPFYESEYENSFMAPFSVESNSVNYYQMVVSYTDKEHISGGKSILQSCNRAGDGAIDLFNGNMMFAHSDFNLEGTQLPINISHVYNAKYYNEEADATYMCGKGWRLNFLQKIKLMNAAKGEFPDTPGYKCYEYTDASGQKHEISTRYYKNRTYDGKTYKIYGEYKENDNFYSEISNGIYTLTQENNNEIVLTDKAKNKLRFNSNGRLISIEKPETINNNNLKMTFTYSTNMITVTGGTGRKVYLNFIDGFLSTIIYNNETVLTFEYIPIMYGIKFLYRIVYGAAGTDNFTQFAYNSNGCLSMITDPAGYILKYRIEGNERPIAMGYTIQTSTEHIAYDENENSGIVTSLDIKKADEITIDYNTVANNFWLFFNSMNTIENMTSVTNAAGAKHFYYFNSDGTLQLEFDDNKNTIVNSSTLTTKEIDGCKASEITQRSATVIGTSSVAADESEYGNFFPRNAYLQVQNLSCISYALATGWYVFMAKVTGAIAAAERLDTLNNAETTYLALKIQYTYKNGDTRVEFKQFDPSVRGRQKNKSLHYRSTSIAIFTVRSIF